MKLHCVVVEISRFKDVTFAVFLGGWPAGAGGQDVRSPHRGLGGCYRAWRLWQLARAPPRPVEIDAEVPHSKI
jgi:hypothetical protein